MPQENRAPRQMRERIMWRAQPSEEESENSSDDRRRGEGEAHRSHDDPVLEECAAIERRRCVHGARTEFLRSMIYCIGYTQGPCPRELDYAALFVAIIDSALLLPFRCVDLFEDYADNCRISSDCELDLYVYASGS